MANQLMGKALASYVDDCADAVLDEVEKDKKYGVLQGNLDAGLIALARVASETDNSELRNSAYELERTINLVVSAVAAKAYKNGLRDGYRAQKDFEEFILGNPDHKSYAEVAQ